MRNVIPSSSVRVAFLRRPDIAALPAEEQERRWHKLELSIENFWRVMERCGEKPIVADTVDEAGRELRRRLEVN